MLQEQDIALFRVFLQNHSLTRTLEVLEEEWAQKKTSAGVGGSGHLEEIPSREEDEDVAEVQHHDEVDDHHHLHGAAAAAATNIPVVTGGGGGGGGMERPEVSNALSDSSVMSANAPPPSLVSSAMMEQPTKSGSSIADHHHPHGQSTTPLTHESVDPYDERAPSSSPTSKYGIVSFEGFEDTLWDMDETAPEAPVFPNGAGFSAAAFDSLDLAAEVPRVPIRPYLKEPPPTGLPLESFDLRVIYEAGRTGFEDVKDFPIVPNTVIAGRYQILQFLDSAAFSRAVKCLDLKHHHEVCIKIIRNSKDFFDQSLDEIKLLQYINSAGDADKHCVLQLYDFFYFKEHIFIVCELLRDNLYEFGKYNREHEDEPYFTLARVQSIAKQVLTGLAFIHEMKLMHCDLKPENILIKSYSRCEVRVIDFGSSCFTTDNLSSYIQSRCYRAPEVILGCHYDGRIDVWSIGAILPELMTGNVMFHNKSVPGMLARIAGVCGPFPQRMLHEGRHTCRFVTKHGVFYETDKDSNATIYHFPQTPSLEEMDLGSTDPDYLDFVRKALTVDHTVRPTARQLLEHPFLQRDYGPAYSPPPAPKSKGTSVTSSPLPK